MSQDSVAIPDDIFDQAFGPEDGADTTADVQDPEVADDESPPPDEDNQDDLDPDADEETDEEEGDDEGAEEDEDEADAEDTNPDQPAGKAGKPSEDAEAFFDRKEIEGIKDPEARRVAEKAYRSMHAAFTKKTTEVAALRKDAERVQGEALKYASEYEDFVAEISTEKGAEDFLLAVAEERPAVFTESVLVQAALANPEAFEAAVERVQAINEDPNEKKRFERDRNADRRDREAERKERGQQRQQAAARREQLNKLVSERAATHGVKSETALGLIRDQVTLLLQRNSSRGQKTTRADIEAAVDKAAKHIRADREAVTKDRAAQERKAKQEQARALARNGKRSPPPGAGRSPAATPAFKRPEKDEDVLGALVDQYFI